MAVQLHNIFQLNAVPFCTALKRKVGNYEVAAGYQGIIEILFIGGVTPERNSMFAQITGNAQLAVVSLYVFGTGLRIAEKDIAGRLYIFGHKTFALYLQFPVSSQLI